MTWGRVGRTAGLLLASFGVAAAGLAWNGEEPLFAYPESAMLLVLSGILVIASGFSATFSLFVRVVAMLGFTHVLLTVLSTVEPGYSSPLTATLLTGLAFCAASTVAWATLPASSNERYRDALLFVTAGALVTAIGVRDTLGPSFSPYVLDNVGLWFLSSVGVALLVWKASRPRENSGTALAASRDLTATRS